MRYNSRNFEKHKNSSFSLKQGVAIGVTAAFLTVAGIIGFGTGGNPEPTSSYIPESTTVSSTANVEIEPMTFDVAQCDFSKLVVVLTSDDANNLDTIEMADEQFEKLGATSYINAYQNDVKNTINEAEVENSGKTILVVNIGEKNGTDTTAVLTDYYDNDGAYASDSFALAVESALKNSGIHNTTIRKGRSNEYQGTRECTSIETEVREYLKSTTANNAIKSVTISPSKNNVNFTAIANAIVEGTARMTKTRDADKRYFKLLTQADEDSKKYFASMNGLKMSDVKSYGGDDGYYNITVRINEIEEALAASTKVINSAKENKY